MTDTPENTAPQVPEELAPILKMAQVATLRQTDSELIVETTVINSRHDTTERLHRLGAYAMHFSLTEPTVRFFRKEGPFEANGYLWQAPFVHESGRAGFGSATDVMYMLLRAKDYATAVIVAIAFLECSNTNDSWGQNLKHWPLAEEAAA